MSGRAPRVAADAGLRVHFSFNEGDLTARGRGPDAVDIVGANVSAINGISGEGIQCDTNQATFDHGSDFVAGMAEHTVSAWTNEGTGTEGATFRDLLMSTTGNQIHIVVDQSDTDLSVFTGGSFIGSGFLMSTLSPGWHHIATVGHDSQTDFYVDGEFVGTAAFNVIQGVTSLGNHTNEAAAQSWGAFDEVRIYDRALEVGEIARLFSHPGGVQIPRRRRLF